MRNKLALIIFSSFSIALLGYFSFHVIVFVLSNKNVEGVIVKHHTKHLSIDYPYNQTKFSVSQIILRNDLRFEQGDSVEIVLHSNFPQMGKISSIFYLYWIGFLVSLLFVLISYKFFWKRSPTGTDIP